MQLTQQQWETLHQSYGPEMVDLVIQEYERQRNKTIPDDCKSYSVNRKRYNLDFWREVLQEHHNHGLNPYDVIPFSRIVTGGRTPWPDMLKRLPATIAQDPLLHQRLTSSRFNPFTLGKLKGCITLQQLDDAVARIKASNPIIQPLRVYV